MSTPRPHVQLYLADHRGIYIPRDFAHGTKRECVEGIDQADWDAIASGPDHEWYWEAWDAICQDAILTEPGTGTRYTLYQDGDLWIVPVGMEWDDREGWIWPASDDEPPAPGAPPAPPARADDETAHYRAG